MWSGVLRGKSAVRLVSRFDPAPFRYPIADFYRTDVEVPCTMIVDGKKYTNVGVHFRGNSSYLGVPAGLKHSLGLSIDLADNKQRLYGYKTLRPQLACRLHNN